MIPRRRLLAISAVGVFGLVFASFALAEVAQKGNVRIAFSGSLKPKKLPRAGVAPVRVSLGGAISTIDGADPPALHRIEIAINRNGRLNPKALPACRLDQIQPASTAYARRACAASMVGEGVFNAAVSIPDQSPYPSEGAVSAFNGVEHGKPVVFLHVYGTEPLPTSFTLPLSIKRSSGTFGTMLAGTLPSVDIHVGFVTGIELRLGGGNSSGKNSYLTASCPAPKGFASASFSLVRAGFSFTEGPTIAETLVRKCKARG